MRDTGTMTGRTRTYLTKQDKEDIRQAYNNGTAIWKLAEWYGVTEFTIHKLIAGCR